MSMTDLTRKLRRRLVYAQTLAYLLIVTTAALGFLMFAETQGRLCRVSYENRVAIRTLISEISTLGENLVKNDSIGQPPGVPLTEEQQDTLRQFREFEDSQLSRLELPTCP